jgi:type 1 fimbria pilin
MNKILLTALAAVSALAIAAPASAQSVTGVVNITGNVASKCIVATPGAPTGPATFGGTVALGDLAQANGTLATDLATRFNAVGNNTQLQYKIVCTSANTNVSVDADPILASTGLAQPGYANRVDYNANVAVTLVSGAGTPVSNDSSAAAATTANYSNRLAATGTNITVTADTFRTANLTDILVADASYTGKITIVVSPGA